ncbi:unnamed protein product [Lepeophtheirus salmonis]|uniref:(salmon louse) hypothetical protein n=1 Tax=Lepeophtheirus salmonis TaxID=72036 RepID=A0A7R8CEZ0_LEPSM|nr:unnamed protein product [Lepeophtheirus salmonis]CAF2800815.1 unnamed protein product [Lepeophtheirus salmonis]
MGHLTTAPEMVHIPTFRTYFSQTNTSFERMYRTAELTKFRFSFITGMGFPISHPKYFGHAQCKRSDAFRSLNIIPRKRSGRTRRSTMLHDGPFGLHPIQIMPAAITQQFLERQSGNVFILVSTCCSINIKGKETIEILHVRTKVDKRIIETIFSYHEEKLLTKFSASKKKCCDPIQIRPNKARIKSLKKLTLF